MTSKFLTISFLCLFFKVSLFLFYKTCKGSRILILFGFLLGVFVVFRMVSESCTYRLLLLPILPKMTNRLKTCSKAGIKVWLRQPFFTFTFIKIKCNSSKNGSIVIQTRYFVYLGVTILFSRDSRLVLILLDCFRKDLDTFWMDSFSFRFECKNYGSSWIVLTGHTREREDARCSKWRSSRRRGNFEKKQRNELQIENLSIWKCRLFVALKIIGGDKNTIGNWLIDEFGSRKNR